MTYLRATSIGHISCDSIWLHVILALPLSDDAQIALRTQPLRGPETLKVFEAENRSTDNSLMSVHRDAGQTVHFVALLPAFARCEDRHKSGLIAKWEYTGT